MWTMSWEKVSLGMYRQRMLKLALAFVQSDRVLHCSLTESLDTTECMIGEDNTWHGMISKCTFCAHNENTPIQIHIENFTSKIWKFSDKKLWYFSYFSSKHRLWVRRCGSNEYPQSMFRAEIRKNNVYPCNPEVYYIKVGLKGVKII